MITLPQNSETERCKVVEGRSRFKVGVQLEPQGTTMDELRSAWRAADELGLDSLWTWDHFQPVRGDRQAPHFEGWCQLAAMAVETSHTRIGVLVSCAAYRNADLLADMARTVDHLSGGRLNLGLGAGWYAEEFEDYGYEFGTARSRIDLLETTVARVRYRLPRLVPPPVGPVPLMIGGGGPTRTLRIVAEYADSWNLVASSAAEFEAKNACLTGWCHRVGRDPATVERTVLINDPSAFGRAAEFHDAGAEHIILGAPSPFDFRHVRALLDAAA